MGEEKHMNLHPEAVRFRNDLQGVFSSFKEITLCGLTEQFVDFLGTKGQPIKFVTVYKYLTETTPPGWLIPYIFEFLSREPYSSSPYVWIFIQKYSRPVTHALDSIKKQVEKRKQTLLDEAGKINQFL